MKTISFLASLTEYYVESDVLNLITGYVYNDN